MLLYGLILLWNCVIIHVVKSLGIGFLNGSEVLNVGRFVLVAAALAGPRVSPLVHDVSNLPREYAIL